MDLTLKAGNATEQRVLDYLCANASEVLAGKINAGKKTLAGALDYAKQEAKKLAKGEACVCVDDATVFGWIVHFFEEEHIEQPKAKPAVKLPGGVKPKAQTAKPAKKPAAAPVQTSMFEALFQPRRAT